MSGQGVLSQHALNAHRQPVETLPQIYRLQGHADARGRRYASPSSRTVAPAQDQKGFVIRALETGGRPMELLALHKNDVRLTEGYVGLPGTKTVRAKRDVPLTDGAKKVLGRPIAASPNGCIFPVRRPKTRHKEAQHIAGLKKPHERVIEDNFPRNPFKVYTFG